MSGLQTNGSVSSRFVSQTDIDEAKKNKAEEWKAAYARLGQEPPPQPEEGEYDPRSLFEKLQQQKDIKREQWDEKMKMGNQFRGLDSEEIGFLTDEKNKQEAAQRAQREEEESILAQFRSAQRRSASPPPSLVATFGMGTSATSTSKPSSATTAAAAAAAPRSLAPSAKPRNKKAGGLPAGIKVQKKKPAATPVKTSAPAADQKEGEDEEAKKRKREENAPAASSTATAAVREETAETGKKAKLARGEE